MSEELRLSSFADLHVFALCSKQASCCVMSQFAHRHFVWVYMNNFIGFELILWSRDCGLELVTCKKTAYKRRASQVCKKQGVCSSQNTDQSASRPVDQWPSGPVAQWPMQQWTNGPIDQWTNWLVDQCTNGPMDQWTSRPVDQWTSGPVDQ